MPTQSKKSASVTLADKPAKPKKKKKKEAGRINRNSVSKTPASGPDSSSEGTHRKSRTKSRADRNTDTEKEAATNLSSKSYSLSTGNTSSTSWRTSSADGRSTSSSGENFGSTSCTVSASLETRDKEMNNLTSSSSLTRVNETIRWDFTECDDPDEEEERLRIYKLHRRKRYLDFLHKRTGGEPQSSQFYA